MSDPKGSTSRKANPASRRRTRRTLSHQANRNNSEEGGCRSLKNYSVRNFRGNSLSILHSRSPSSGGLTRRRGSVNGTHRHSHRTGDNLQDSEQGQFVNFPSTLRGRNLSPSAFDLSARAGGIFEQIRDIKKRLSEATAELSPVIFPLATRDVLTAVSLGQYEAAHRLASPNVIPEASIMGDDAFHNHCSCCNGALGYLAYLISKCPSFDHSRWSELKFILNNQNPIGNPTVSPNVKRALNELVTVSVDLAVSTVPIAEMQEMERRLQVADAEVAHSNEQIQSLQKLLDGLHGDFSWRRRSASEDLNVASMKTTSIVAWLDLATSNPISDSESEFKRHTDISSRQAGDQDVDLRAKISALICDKEAELAELRRGAVKWASKLTLIMNKQAEIDGLKGVLFGELAQPPDVSEVDTVTETSKPKHSAVEDLIGQIESLRGDIAAFTQSFEPSVAQQVIPSVEALFDALSKIFTHLQLPEETVPKAIVQMDDLHYQKIESSSTAAENDEVQQVINEIIASYMPNTSPRHLLLKEAFDALNNALMAKNIQIEEMKRSVEALKQETECNKEVIKLLCESRLDMLERVAVLTGGDEFKDDFADFISKLRASATVDEHVESLNKCSDVLSERLKAWASKSQETNETILKQKDEEIVRLLARLEEEQALIKSHFEENKQLHDQIEQLKKLIPLKSQRPRKIQREDKEESAPLLKAFDEPIQLTPQIPPNRESPIESDYFEPFTSAINIGETEILDFQSKLNDQAALINQLEARLCAQNEEFRFKLAEASEKTSQFSVIQSSYETDIQQLKSVLRQKTNEVSDLKVMLDSSQQQIFNLNGQITEMKGQIATAEDELKTIQEEAISRNLEVERFHCLMHDKNQEMNDLREVLTRHEKQVQDLRFVLNNKDADLTEKNSLVQTLSSKLSSCMKDAEAIKKDFEQLNIIFDRLWKSTLLIDDCSEHSGPLPPVQSEPLQILKTSSGVDQYLGLLLSKEPNTNISQLQASIKAYKSYRESEKSRKADLMEASSLCIVKDDLDLPWNSCCVTTVSAISTLLEDARAFNLLRDLAYSESCRVRLANLLSNAEAQNSQLKSMLTSLQSEVEENHIQLAKMTRQLILNGSDPNDPSLGKIEVETTNLLDTNFPLTVTEVKQAASQSTVEYPTIKQYIDDLELQLQNAQQAIGNLEKRCESAESTAAKATQRLVQAEGVASGRHFNTGASPPPSEEIQVLAKLLTTEADIQIISEKIVNMQEEILDNRAEKGRLQQQLYKVRDQLEKLTTSLSHQHEADVSELEKRFASILAEKSLIEEQLEKQRGEVSRKTADLANLESEKDNLWNQLKMTEDALKKRESELKSLNTENESLQQQMHRLEDDNAQKTSKNLSLVAEIESLTKLLNESKAAVTPTSLAELTAKSPAPRTQPSLMTHVKDEGSLVHVIDKDRLMAQLTALFGALSPTSISESDDSASWSVLIGRVESGIANIMKDNADLKQRLAALESERDDLRTEYDQILEARIEKAIGAQQKLEEEVRRKDEELRVIEERLQQSVADSSTKAGELKQLRQQLHGLGNEIASKSDEIIRLNQMLDDLRIEKSTELSVIEAVKPKEVNVSGPNEDIKLLLQVADPGCQNQTEEGSIRLNSGERRAFEDQTVKAEELMSTKELRIEEIEEENRKFVEPVVANTERESALRSDLKNKECQVKALEDALKAKENEIKAIEVKFQQENTVEWEMEELNLRLQALEKELAIKSDECRSMIFEMKRRTQNRSDAEARTLTSVVADPPLVEALLLSGDSQKTSIIVDAWHEYVDENLTVTTVDEDLLIARLLSLTEQVTTASDLQVEARSSWLRLLELVDSGVANLLKDQVDLKLQISVLEAKSNDLKKEIVAKEAKLLSLEDQALEQQAEILNRDASLRKLEDYIRNVSTRLFSQISDLKEFLNSSESRVAKLSSILESSSAREAELIAQIRSMSNQENHLQLELEEERSKTEALKTENEHLLSRCNQISRALNDQEVKIADIEDALKLKEEEALKLVEGNQAMPEDQASRILSIEEFNEMLEISLKEKNDEIKDLKARLYEAEVLAGEESVLRQRRLQIKEVHAEIPKTVELPLLAPLDSFTRITELENDLRVKEDKIKAMEEKLQQMESIASEVNGLQNQLMVLQAENRNKEIALKSMESKLQQAILEYSKQSEAVMAETEELHRQLQNLEEVKDQKSAECSGLLHMMDNMAKELEVAKARESVLMSLSETIFEPQENQMMESKSVESSVKEEETEANKNIRINEEQATRIADLEVLNNKLEKTLYAKEMEESALRQKLKALEESMVQKEIDCNRLIAEVSSLTHLSVDAQSKTPIMEAIEPSLVVSVAAEPPLSSALVEMEDVELIELRRINEEQRRRIVEMEEKSNLKDVLDAKDAEIHSLEDRLSRLGDVENANLRLSAEIVKLKEKVSDLDELEELRKCLQDLEEDNERKTNEVQRLNEEMLELREELAKSDFGLQKLETSMLQLHSKLLSQSSGLESTLVNLLAKEANLESQIFEKAKNEKEIAIKCEELSKALESKQKDLYAMEDILTKIKEESESTKVKLQQASIYSAVEALQQKVHNLEDENAHKAMECRNLLNEVDELTVELNAAKAREAVLLSTVVESNGWHSVKRESEFYQMTPSTSEANEPLEEIHAVKSVNEELMARINKVEYNLKAKEDELREMRTKMIEASENVKISPTEIEESHEKYQAQEAGNTIQMDILADLTEELEASKARESVLMTLASDKATGQASELELKSQIAELEAALRSKEDECKALEQRMQDEISTLSMDIDASAAETEELRRKLGEMEEVNSQKAVECKRLIEELDAARTREATLQFETPLIEPSIVEPMQSELLASAPLSEEQTVEINASAEIDSLRQENEILASRIADLEAALKGKEEEASALREKSLKVSHDSKLELQGLEHKLDNLQREMEQKVNECNSLSQRLEAAQAVSVVERDELSSLRQEAKERATLIDNLEAALRDKESDLQAFENKAHQLAEQRSGLEERLRLLEKEDLGKSAECEVLSGEVQRLKNELERLHGDLIERENDLQNLKSNMTDLSTRLLFRVNDLTNIVDSGETRIAELISLMKGSKTRQSRLAKELVEKDTLLKSKENEVDALRVEASKVSQDSELEVQELQQRLKTLQTEMEQKATELEAAKARESVLMSLTPDEIAISPGEAELKTQRLEFDITVADKEEKIKALELRIQTFEALKTESDELHQKLGELEGLYAQKIAECSRLSEELDAVKTREATWEYLVPVTEPTVVEPVKTVLVASAPPSMEKKAESDESVEIGLMRPENEIQASRIADLECLLKSQEEEILKMSKESELREQNLCNQLEKLQSEIEQKVAEFNCLNQELEASKARESVLMTLASDKATGQASELELKSQIAELEAALRSKEDECKALEQRMQDEISTLSMDIDASAAETEELRRKLGEMEEVNSQKAVECKRLIEELDAARTREATLQFETPLIEPSIVEPMQSELLASAPLSEEQTVEINASAEIDSLRQENEILASRIADLEAALKGKEEEASALREKSLKVSHDSKLELQGLEHKLDNLQREMEQKVNECNSLSQRLEAAQAVSVVERDELSSLRQEAKERATLIDNLEAALRDKESDLQAFENKAHQLAEQRSGLEERLRLLEKEDLGKSAECEVLSGEVQRLKNELERLHGDLIERENDLQNLKSNMTDLSTRLLFRVNDLTNIVDSGETRIAELISLMKGSKTRQSRLAKELVEKDTLLKSKENEVDALRVEASKVSQDSELEVQELQQRLKTLQTEMEQKATELEAAKARESVLMSLTPDEIAISPGEAELKTQRLEFDITVADKEEKIKALELRIQTFEALKTESDELHQKLGELEGLYAQKIAECSRLSEELDAVKTREATWEYLVPVTEPTVVEPVKTVLVASAPPSMEKKAESDESVEIGLMRPENEIQASRIADLECLLKSQEEEILKMSKESELREQNLCNQLEKLQSEIEQKVAEFNCLNQELEASKARESVLMTLASDKATGQASELELKSQIAELEAALRSKEDECKALEQRMQDEISTLSMDIDASAAETEELRRKLGEMEEVNSQKAVECKRLIEELDAARTREATLQFETPLIEPSIVEPMQSELLASAPLSEEQTVEINASAEIDSLRQENEILASRIADLEAALKGKEEEASALREKSLKVSHDSKLELQGLEHKLDNLQREMEQKVNECNSLSQRLEAAQAVSVVERDELSSLRQEAKERATLIDNLEAALRDKESDLQAFENKAHQLAEQRSGLEERLRLLEKEDLGKSAECEVLSGEVQRLKNELERLHGDLIERENDLQNLKSNMTDLSTRLLFRVNDLTNIVDSGETRIAELISLMKGSKTRQSRLAKELVEKDTLLKSKENEVDALRVEASKVSQDSELEVQELQQRLKTLQTEMEQKATELEAAKARESVLMSLTPDEIAISPGEAELKTQRLEFDITVADKEEKIKALELRIQTFEALKTESDELHQKLGELEGLYAQKIAECSRLSEELDAVKTREATWEYLVPVTEPTVVEPVKTVLVASAPPSMEKKAESDESVEIGLMRPENEIQASRIADLECLLKSQEEEILKMSKESELREQNLCNQLEKLQSEIEQKVAEFNCLNQELEASKARESVLMTLASDKATGQASELELKSQIAELEAALRSKEDECKALEQRMQDEISTLSMDIDASAAETEELRRKLGEMEEVNSQKAVECKRLIEELDAARTREATLQFETPLIEPSIVEPMQSELLASAPLSEEQTVEINASAEIDSLRQENEILASRIADLEAALKGKEEEASALREKSLKVSHDSKLELQGLEHKLDNLQREMEQKVNECNSLSQRLEAAQAVSVVERDELSSLRQEAKERATLIDNLEAALRDKESDLQAFENKAHQLAEQRSGLEERLRLLEKEDLGKSAECEVLSGEVQRLKNELERLHGDLIERENDLQNLKSNMTDLSTRLLFRVNDLTNIVDSGETRIAELISLMKGSKTRQSRLAKELVEKDTLLKSKENEVDALRVEASKVSQDSELEVQELQQRLKTLQTEMEQKATELEAAKARESVLMSLTPDEIAISPGEAELKTQRLEFDITVADKEEKIKALELRIQTFEALKTESDELHQKLGELEGLYAQKIAECSRLSEELDAVKTREATWEYLVPVTEPTVVEPVKTVLVASAPPSMEKKAESDESVEIGLMRPENEIQASRIADLECLLKSQEEEILKMSKESELREQNLCNQLEKLQSEIEQKVAEFNCLNQELEASKARESVLMTLASDKATGQASELELKSQIAELEAALRSKEDECKALEQRMQDEISTLSMDIDASAAETEELRRKLGEMEEVNSQKAVECKRLIEELDAARTREATLQFETPLIEPSIVEPMQSELLASAPLSEEQTVEINASAEIDSLRQENEILASRIADLEAALKGKEEEASALREKSLKVSHDSKLELQGLEHKLDNLQREMEQKVNECNSLSQRLEAAQAVSVVERDELSSLRQEAKERATLIDNLEAALRDKESDLQAFENKAHQLAEQRSGLEERLRLLEKEDLGKSAECEVLSGEVQRLKNELERLHGDLIERENDLQNLKSNMTDLSTRLLFRVNDLTNIVDSGETRIAELISLMKGSKTRQSRLAKELVEKDTLLKSKENEVDALRVEASKVSQDSELEVQELQQRLKTLQTEMEQKATELEAAKARESVLMSLTPDEIAISPGEAELKTQRLEFDITVADKEEKIKALELRIQTFEALKTESDELHQKLGELEGLYAQKIAECSRLSEELDAVKTREATWEYLVPVTEPTVVEPVKTVLVASAPPSMEKKAESDESVEIGLMRPENEIQASRIADLECLLKSQEEEILKMSKESELREQNLCNQLEKLQSEIEQKVAEFNCLNQELEASKARESVLMTLASDKATGQASELELKSQIAELEAALRSKEDECKALEQRMQDEISTLSMDIDASAAETEELRRKLGEMEEVNSQKAVECKRLIEELDAARTREATLQFETPLIEPSIVEPMQSELLASAPLSEEQTVEINASAEIDSLRQENEILASRIADLEAALHEKDARLNALINDSSKSGLDMDVQDLRQQFDVVHPELNQSSDRDARPSGLEAAKVLDPFLMSLTSDEPDFPANVSSSNTQKLKDIVNDSESSVDVALKLSDSLEMESHYILNDFNDLNPEFPPAYEYMDFAKYYEQSRSAEPVVGKSMIPEPLAFCAPPVEQKADFNLSSEQQISRIAELESALRAKEDELVSLQQKLSEEIPKNFHSAASEDIVESLKDTFSFKDLELTAQKDSHLSSAEDEKAIDSNEIQRFTNETVEYEKELMKRDAILCDLEARMNDISSRLFVQLNSLENIVNSIESRVSHLISMVDDLSRMEANLRDEVTKRSRLETKLRAQVDEEKARSRNISGEMVKLKSEKDELNRRCNLMVEEMKSHFDEQKTLEDALKAREIQQKTLEEALKSKDINLLALEGKLSEMEQLKYHLRVLEADNSRQASEINNLLQQLNDAKAGVQMTPVVEPSIIQAAMTEPLLTAAPQSEVGAEFQNLLRDKEARLTRIAEIENINEKLTETLKARENEYQALENILETKESELKNMEELLNSKEFDLKLLNESLQQTLSMKSSEIGSLQQRIQALEEENSSKAAELASMLRETENSTKKLNVATSTLTTDSQPVTGREAPTLTQHKDFCPKNLSPFYTNIIEKVLLLVQFVQETINIINISSTVSFLSFPSLGCSISELNAQLSCILSEIKFTIQTMTLASSAMDVASSPEKSPVPLFAFIPTSVDLPASGSAESRCDSLCTARSLLCIGVCLQNQLENLLHQAMGISNDDGIKSLMMAWSEFFERLQCLCKATPLKAPEKSFKEMPCICHLTPDEATQQLMSEIVLKSPVLLSAVQSLPEEGSSMPNVLNKYYSLSEHDLDIGFDRDVENRRVIRYLDKFSSILALYADRFTKSSAFPLNTLFELLLKLRLWLLDDTRLPSVVAQKLPMSFEIPSTELYLRRILNIRDTEVLYLLNNLSGGSNLINRSSTPYALPSGDCTEAQLRLMSNWDLVQPIDPSCIPVYRVKLPELGEIPQIPSNGHSESQLAERSPSYQPPGPSVAALDDSQTSIFRVELAADVKFLLRKCWNILKEMVQTFKLSTKSKMLGSQADELLDTTIKLSRLLNGVSTDEAVSFGDFKKIPQSPGLPCKFSKAPIQELIWAIDNLEDIEELRSLAHLLTQQYNAIGTTLEQQLNLNRDLRDRLREANNYLARIYLGISEGSQRLAVMRERLLVETQKNEELSSVCDDITSSKPEPEPLKVDNSANAGRHDDSYVTSPSEEPQPSSSQKPERHKSSKFLSHLRHALKPKTNR